METQFFDCEENLFFYLLVNYHDGFAIYNILLIVFAIWELIITVGRLWDSYKNLHFAQMSVKSANMDENKNNVENAASINNFNQSMINNNLEEENNINSKYLNIKNLTLQNKWDILTFNDKMKFFNMWLILFFFGNIFQIFTGVINLTFPIFAENNMLFNSISCMLAWFGIGYFFDVETHYSFFYKILKKTTFHYLKFILLFALILFVFIIMGLSVFPNNHLFSGFSSSGIFFFSMIFGDSMLTNCKKISDEHPYFVVFFVFLFFLCFNTLCLRIFTTLTEDAFDSIKMKSSYNWLDKKLSIDDYIMDQLKSKDEDEDENQEFDHNHFMVPDIFIQVLLMRENEINEKMEEYLIKEDSKLKKDFLFRDEIEFNLIVKQKLKKLKKNLLSKNFMNDIIKHDNLNDPMQINLQLGKGDFNNKKLKKYFDYGEMIFKCIIGQFKKIGNIVFVQQRIFMKKLTKEEMVEILELVIRFTDKILMRISRENSNKPKFKRMNTAGNIIFTLND